MSQILYRANLAAASFPFIAENFGRSVIISGPDQNYNRVTDTGVDKDAGIPQIYYCHNVLPVTEGLQSIGYNTLISPISPSEVSCTKVYQLRDSAERKAFFSHTLDGRNLISLSPFYSWIETTNIPAATSPTIEVSVAYIQGETYIYFSNVGCYRYDFATNSLVLVTLISLVPASISGITSAYGYMVAVSDTVVYWSSTTNPLNFNPVVPSENGAGSAAILSAKGKFTAAIPTSYGFLLFTTNNAIAAYYSGNAAYPFNFQELLSSGGLASKSLVSFSSNSAELYAYTTSGLQVFSTQKAETILPELTDFIAGAYFEDFSETTLTFTRQQLSTTLLKKLTLISNRYLVISYGILELTHAIVYDLVQQRLGKLKVTHTDCFEWSILAPEVTETPKRSIAFLLKTGEVKIVDFDVADEYANGVLILGKFQYVRQRLIQLHEVELENVRITTNFKLYDMANMDGKESTTLQEYTLTSASNAYRRYVGRKTAINHSLIFKGAFQLTSLVLNFSVGGSR